MNGYTIDKDKDRCMTYFNRTLVSYTFPSDAVKINDYAFGSSNSNAYMTNSIVSIDVTDAPNITSVGDYAFNGCRKFATITGDLNNLESIGECGFNRCMALTTFPQLSVVFKSIGKQAFAYTKLNSLSFLEGISDEMDTIPNHCFNSVSSLSNYNIDVAPGSTQENSFIKNIKTFGDYCFYNCRFPLMYLDDTFKVETIDRYAFYSSFGGIGIHNSSLINQSKRICYSGCTSLKYIGDYGMYLEQNDSANGIGSIDLSGCSSLESIGQYAFKIDYTNQIDSSKPVINFNGCSSLKTISAYAISFKEASLNEYCDVDFSGCTSLETLGYACLPINNNTKSNRYIVGMDECRKSLTTIGNFVASSANNLEVAFISKRDISKTSTSIKDHSFLVFEKEGDENVTISSYAFTYLQFGTKIVFLTNRPPIFGSNWQYLFFLRTNSTTTYQYYMGVPFGQISTYTSATNYPSNGESRKWSSTTITMNYAENIYYQEYASLDKKSYTVFTDKTLGTPAVLESGKYYMHVYYDPTRTDEKILTCICYSWDGSTFTKIG